MESDHPHRTHALRARAWLLEQAIPFWSSRGVDAHGLAFEEASFDGSMRETGYRRTVVQFRQTYVFAIGALLGACQKETALKLFERTVSSAWHSDGGWVHRLSPDGKSVIDPTRDAYDHAFALFAAAWVYRLGRDPRALEVAQRTLAFMDEHMRAPGGGYYEALPVRSPRRQNPHMHLYEALLALYAVSADPSYLARAEELRALCATRFLSAHGGLREYFDDQLAPLADARGEIVEPGHHYEWTWLLREHARLVPGSDDSLATSLYAFANRFGLDAAGLPVEQIDTHGKHVLGGCKLWAVCEAIKAHAVIDGRSSAINPLIDALFARFLSASARTANGAPIWFEGLTATGEPDSKRMPASTLYHLTFAISELLRVTGVARVAS